jgi:hypothetical protein
MKFKFLVIIFGFVFFIGSMSASHYVVGIAGDALDGTSADGHSIVLWNELNGINDNLTDIIGPSGNSGVSNVYFVDCELLNEACSIGDVMTVKVYDNGDGYISSSVNVTITGAGYDVAPNITMNSPPFFSDVVVEDFFLDPVNEIDLLAASTQIVNCSAVVTELDYDGLFNISSEFFDSSDSFYGDSDDNNYHYTNNSCFVNYSYGGSNEAMIVCSYNVWYYANPRNWKCVITAEDNWSTMGNGSDETNINTLLSVGLIDSVDFGKIDARNISEEEVLSVTNYGNVMINLSLRGYGSSEYDSNAMTCTMGAVGFIPVNYEKFNLTVSNPGDLTLSEFENVYSNLTSNAVSHEFNLDSRDDDLFNNALKDTYWRIYVPEGVYGDCEGHIVFGAIAG